MAAREFEGNVEQPDEEAAAGEGNEDVPLGDVGEGALFVVKPHRVIGLGPRQMRGELRGIGVGGDGDEVFAIEFEVDGLAFDFDADFVVLETPLAGDGRLAHAVAGGDENAITGGGPLGLLEAIEVVRVVAAKIERELVVGVDLVRVPAAGGIVPIEVNPIHHPIEGFHKAQRGIGNARANDDGKDE